MKNKKIEELKLRIEDLEKTLFYINMVDHWTREDREAYEMWSKKLQETKQMLTEALLED